MEVFNMPINQQERIELDQIILRDFPTPFAVMYKRMLADERWQIKTQLALELFEMWMKSMTLQMLLQYLDRDIQHLDNEATGKLKGEINKIFKPSLGDVVGLFFRLLEAYKGNSGLLFMPELYGIQWDGEVKLSNAREDFDALIPMRNELAHGRNKPQTEADWQATYLSVERSMLSVLSHFQFIKNYIMVYGLQIKRGKGTFLSLQGLEPTHIILDLPKANGVVINRYYVTNRQGSYFYNLFPFFLPWPSNFLDWEKRDNVENQEQIHTAIYDSYLKNKVRYSVVTEYVKELVLADKDAIDRFLELFEERLQQAQAARTEVKSLHWVQFKRTANEITAIETEAIREKFSKDLYLQREHIKSAFEHFLKSEKVAFVLLGKSGVGKSNFVLSMSEAYREIPDTHLIIFNSARLTSEEGLTEALTRMFASKLRLREAGKERKIENILDEINNIQEIKGKKVILAFDAINENPVPHMLLKRIDELVAYNKYPWLKVMVTSRPEAWQNMKRQSRLTESKYYRQSDTDEMGVELTGFDMQASDGGGWLTVDRFKQVELPDVYGLYQAKYRLKTDFDALSPEMKVMLRDPLALRLVAESYGSTEERSSKDGILPGNVRTSKLYEQYINSLINDGRLERNDVKVFLGQKILPLMFSAGGYRNTLDAEILTETIDKVSGKSLSEEIELDDILPSTGKRVNQSFQNLVDTGILGKQGSYSGYEINFTYERFYDYFGGNYLFERASSVGRDKVQNYKNLIYHAAQYPYLSGVLGRVLTLERASGGEKSVLQSISQLQQHYELRLYSFLKDILIGMDEFISD